MRPDRRRDDSPRNKTPYIAKWLQEISPGNRGTVQRLLQLKHGQGAKMNTLVRHPLYLRHFDNSLQGKAWKEVDAGDATAFLSWMHTANYAPDTIISNASYTKAFLKWAMDIPALPAPWLPLEPTTRCGPSA